MYILGNDILMVGGAKFSDYDEYFNNNLPSFV